MGHLNNAHSFEHYWDSVRIGPMLEGSTDERPPCYNSNSSSCCCSCSSRLVRTLLPCCTVTTVFIGVALCGGPLLFCCWYCCCLMRDWGRFFWSVSNSEPYLRKKTEYFSAYKGMKQETGSDCLSIFALAFMLN